MIHSLVACRRRLLSGVSPTQLFSVPPRKLRRDLRPVITFRPSHAHCPGCDGSLKVQKTHSRMVSTLHVGQFRALEIILVCTKCDHRYRSEELSNLVPPGANFGYDVLVYTGQALFLRHRNEEEVVAELAERNVQISPRVEDPA